MDEDSHEDRRFAVPVTVYRQTAVMLRRNQPARLEQYVPGATLAQRLTAAAASGEPVDMEMLNGPAFGQLYVGLDEDREEILALESPSVLQVLVVPEAMIEQYFSAHERMACPSFHPENAVWPVSQQ